MTDRARRSGSTLGPALLLVAVFLALTWPAILSQNDAPSQASDDHRQYHEPVIRSFAAQWPRVDLTNYESATTPGYHLLMALFSRYISPAPVAMQMLSSIFGLGLLLVVFLWTARHVGGWLALALVTPLLCSRYVLSGSIWLTTDNAGWFFVSIALGGAAMSVPTSRRIGGSALAATAAVLVRQIHLWVTAPIAIAGLLQSRGRAAVLTLILPFLVVGTFALMWGGLTPPGFVEQHHRGVNPALVPLAISLIGAFGVFFLPCFGVRWSEARRDGVVWLAALVGLATAVAIPTSFSFEQGRWGGAIWSLAARLPAIGDRNLLFPPLAALGGAVLACAWRGAQRNAQSRGALALLIAIVCWAAAQSANSQAWQRYCEPLALMALIWFAALALGRRSTNHLPHRATAAHSMQPHSARTAMIWVGPLLLGLAQLGLAFAALYLPMLRAAGR